MLYCIVVDINAKSAIYHFETLAHKFAYFNSLFIMMRKHFDASNLFRYFVGECWAI